MSRWLHDYRFHNYTTSGSYKAISRSRNDTTLSESTKPTMQELTDEDLGTVKYKTSKRGISIYIQRDGVTFTSKLPKNTKLSKPHDLLNFSDIASKSELEELEFHNQSLPPEKKVRGKIAIAKHAGFRTWKRAHNKRDPFKNQE